MFFKGKKILIIGGTGTIGQSILTQLLKENPALIRIFSRDEYKQFKLQNKYFNRKNINFVIGDVREYKRLIAAMEEVDYVFHVASMKQVTSCESNPFEAVLTNIVGTQNVINAAKAQSVKKVVFTSSDKAINPTNTYGATKLIAERLISTNKHQDGKTNFSCVRFGNVIGSRGSVVPLFVNQIQERKKIQVTNMTMSRFMMTLTQATELTMKALQESKGGEVFVLKMPVIILKDLVNIIIEETCIKHNINSDEIEIEEIGLRPGEKMYEELMTADESTRAWDLGNMLVLPSNENNYHYATIAQKVKFGTHSSEHYTPISSEEIRKILINEKLI